MKALFLAVGAAAATATLPASAQVMTIGSTLAEGCYRAAQSRDDRREALETCHRALREEALTYRDRVATLVNRGIVRMVKEDDEAARRDFRTAIALDANQPEAWLNMAILQLNHGDSAGAIPLFNRALELRTQAPEIAYYARGLAHEQRGNLGAAYADLSRAASLKPGWDKPAQELGRYRVRRR